MAVTTLNSVADYLLCFAQEHGDVMTPLKLQKWCSMLMLGSWR
ncbi:hypothetical protein ACFYKR_22520 [Escherichia coli]